MTLEADARRQSSEEQAARRKDAPHLLEHRRELPLVACEVQNGAADDRVRRAILPRKGIERAAMKLAWRQLPGATRRRAGAPSESPRRPIHRPHIEAVSQEKRKIMSRAAAGVEHTAATVESSAKKLIER